MTRLTISLEQDLLEAATREAQQRGTTLEQVVRSYLESYVAEQPARQREAIARLLDLSSKVQSGSGGRKWTRDEIHER
jgi:metal-responsive CopG/Arc/MetJ family transcriptional regulator